jgi:hypothetical protein
VALGFVNGEIDVALRTAEKFAIDANLIQTRIGFGARLGNDVSVDGDDTGGDQLLGFAA